MNQGNDLNIFDARISCCSHYTEPFFFYHLNGFFFLYFFSFLSFLLDSFLWLYAFQRTWNEFIFVFSIYVDLVWEPHWNGTKRENMSAEKTIYKVSSLVIWKTLKNAWLFLSFSLLSHSIEEMISILFLMAKKTQKSSKTHKRQEDTSLIAEWFIWNWYVNDRHHNGTKCQSVYLSSCCGVCVTTEI